ncbi:ferredoxin-type protein NapF [Shewanella sp. 1CM18E]|uniref:ferredoxin-type protein NapF n=1 Tax=Shewanella sp. 1CM18E TaxID=2929169 RepID=UPI0020C0B1F1|nr:ferredoxin-type protein NapF [Shewanella sp. 1CM18E]MCK8043268.1 ferredoxin-type protein NapF [Shewanella sp. 1CM18E]
MSSINQSRRRIFSRKKTQAIHLPWVDPNIEFTDLCTRCNKCIEACETQILIKGDGGFPEVDFSIDECTFCQKCIQVCEEPLFDLTILQAWNVKAKILDTCMAHQGIWCQSCKDACDSRAISFTLAIGQAPQPNIDIEACTGCGACVFPCPSNAIRIQEIEPCS